MSGRSSNEARFQAALREHAEAISRYCLRRLPRSAVNDVVANVFVVVWRKVETMPDGEGTLPWLYAVARNEVMKAKRSAARRANLRGRLSSQPRYPEAGPESLIVRRAEAAELMRALATLRPADQEILLLRGQEGLTNPEIAVVLGCSLEAAKKRSSRALNRLRKAAGLPSPQESAMGSRATQEGGGTE